MYSIVKPRQILSVVRVDGAGGCSDGSRGSEGSRPDTRAHLGSRGNGHGAIRDRTILQAQQQRPRRTLPPEHQNPHKRATRDQARMVP